jgi:SAM-dependent methyltransferase
VPATEIIPNVARDLAHKIKDAGQGTGSEQALVIAVSAALEPVLDQLGIPKRVEYEKVLLGGRADAVYGSVIIEYEAPGKLATAPGRAEAFGQARQYMREQAELRSPGAPEEALPKLVGVVLDGRQIGFVLWRPGGEPDAEIFEMRSQASQLSFEPEYALAGRFQELGLFAVSEDSVTDLLRFLRALSRRPLEAAALAEEFGPQADTARAVVAALDAALQAPSSTRTTMLYTEWLRLFGAIYGDKSKVKPTNIKALASIYEVNDDDIGRMLFAVHTYFALIMKILAIELVALQSGAVVDPLVAGLADLSEEEFERRFRDLENGDAFRARGIENFLEGDFLGWYAEEWTPALRSAVRTLARQLQDFEPGTSSLRPELTQDLLKELYHRLLPRDLRHALGEYYTPDWLAEYTIDRSGFEAKPGSSMLDPACGSGTFLVAAIKRMKRRSQQEGLSAEKTAKAIVDGIVGFDLNPLAVIAARTNYLLAVGDLVGAIAPFRIPVYICDSISVPARPVNRPAQLRGKHLKTSVGDFFIPDAMATREVLPGVMADLEFCADNDFTTEEFVERTTSALPEAEPFDVEQVGFLYAQICKLKAVGNDGIWPRLLSNAFAPLFHAGRFDHVIGNPPWIRWEEVSAEYRETTKPLWQDYGLFTLSGGAARLGGGKKDMSMLMTQVAAEEYLRADGTLTFLITQTVLQTSGAGDGFRQFYTGRRDLSMRCVDDLANFNPFDDAANWTAIVSLKRDAKTTYPVPYRLWNRRPNERLGRRATLAGALAATDRVELKARPVKSGKPTSPWLLGEAPALEAASRLSGASDYTAKAGVTVWLDGVFQLEVLGVRPDGLVHVRNHADIGKTALDQVDDAIEPDLLFPYVPWKEFGRWRATPDRYLLIPQDPATRAAYPLDVMRKKWPRTLAYLNRFRDKLLARSGYTRYFKPSDPFYAIYNVSASTIAPVKVAWTTMGNSMEATVLGLSRLDPTIAEKPTVFKNTVIYLPMESQDEAFYLTALLNCTWANYLLRASNVRGGKSAFATNVLHSILIPEFNRRSAVARELAELGRRATQYADSGEDERLAVTEVRIDDASARFWSIGERQQVAIHSGLDVLG